MKIGIFGGSFNPPHKMHLNIIEELLNTNILDKIIIVPTGLHYSYKNNLISNEHRYNMLKIMTKHNNKIEVSDFEFKDEENSPKGEFSTIIFHFSSFIFHSFFLTARSYSSARRFQVRRSTLPVISRPPIL